MFLPWQVLLGFFQEMIRGLPGDEWQHHGACGVPGGIHQVPSQLLGDERLDLPVS